MMSQALCFFFGVYLGSDSEMNFIMFEHMQGFAGDKHNVFVICVGCVFLIVFLFMSVMTCQFLNMGCKLSFRILGTNMAP
jgi:hypothetical protein